MNKNFKTLLLVAICSLSLQSLCFAQTETSTWKKITANTRLWTELGGHGLAYTVGFEKILINDSDNKLTVQLAAAYYPPELDLIPLWVPLTVNQLIALKKEHRYLEFGLGAMWLEDYPIRLDNLEFKVDNLIFRIGYRVSNPNKKYDFRVGFTPIVLNAFDNRRPSIRQTLYNMEFIPLVGFGFGFRL